MFIINWWNSLSAAAQVFSCMAIPATLILLIQTILMFMGFESDSDGIGDGGAADDFSDADIPDADIDDVFGENTVSDVYDLSGLEGLRIFTLRGVIAFFVVFGWIGLAMDSSGAKLWITIPVATVCGFAMMVLLAFLFKAVLKLRSNGNADNRNAVGTAGKVHLTIPPARTGEGKVHIMLQGSYVERNAVTDDSAAIPTGCEVVVSGISGQTDLVVRRK